MHLDKYLQSQALSQGEFGKKLVPPASQGLVSQWVRGVTRVTLDYALQIEATTVGAVTPQDCADMFSSKAEREPSPAEKAPVIPEEPRDHRSGAERRAQEDRRAVERRAAERRAQEQGAV